MNTDADSFSTAGLISWFSQALCSPVISATNTHFNALDQPWTSQIDYIIWFALGGEMEKTFPLPYKKKRKQQQVKQQPSRVLTAEEPARWVQRILLRK